jgi:hypothetical protein
MRWSAPEAGWLRDRPAKHRKHSRIKPEFFTSRFQTGACRRQHPPAVGFKPMANASNGGTTGDENGPTGSCRV